MKLTAQQAKMALEYFGAQAAEDAPEDWREFATHVWMTQFATSLAVERQISEHDWHVVLTSLIDYQSFDRDPAGYLHERGYSDSPNEQTYMRDTLQDLLSAAIDTAYNNSAA